jgi:hypothetical protein
MYAVISEIRNGTVEDFATRVIKEGEMIQSVEHDVILCESIENWVESGQVTVTADSTLQALLACTPTGPLEPDDLVSPYGMHVTWLDPPISSTGRSERWVLFGTGGSWNTKTVEHCVTLDGPAEGIQDMLDQIARERDEWHQIVFWVVGYNDGTFAAEGEALNDATARLNAPGKAAALRVAIGLSRLIKSHTGAREGEPLIEIQDRGIVKPKGKGFTRGHRSIHIRRLFIVDQDIAEACRAAIRGGPRAPCLRHLVRGHWRNQACGPAHTERNLLWIQPHWRGAMRGVLRPIEVQVR